MASAIETKIVKLVGKRVGMDEAQIHRESRLTEDLNMDSLDAVELVMEMEEEFGMAVPDDAAEKIKTVGDLVDYVSAHGGGAVAKA